MCVQEKPDWRSLFVGFHADGLAVGTVVPAFFCVPPKTMKNLFHTFSLIILSLAFSLHVFGQESRRELEALATEILRQASVTGFHPTDEALSRLAASGNVSIEQICKLHEPDDARQIRLCHRLVEAVVARTLQENIPSSAAQVRSGIKKAMDRSDDAETRIWLLDQLALFACVDDAPQFERYLEDPQTAAAATKALVALPGIGARIDSLARVAQTPGNRFALIAKARHGDAAATGAVNVAAKASVNSKPAALPFWTIDVDKAFERLGECRDAVADSLALIDDVRVSLPALLSWAGRQSGERRTAALVRAVARISQDGLTGEERYLMLRAADALQPCADLRRKIILLLGDTHCVQALAYIRQYSDVAEYADAVGVAVHEITAHVPETVGGRHVRTLLSVAKHSYVRHYDEEGAGAAIDDILACLDGCGAEGYELGQTTTAMGKRGYWNMYEDMSDCLVAFDWKATGTLTLQLRSMPVVFFDRALGVCVAGSRKWHPFAPMGEWSTAQVRLVSGRVSVSVDGHTLIDNVPLGTDDGEGQIKKSGYIAFKADEDGATVRQFCVRRK